MFRRRAKRKTDWLYANTLAATITPVQAPVFLTFPFLPTEFIDQDANGQCTLLRIVGDFNCYFVGTPDENVGEGDTVQIDFGLLRTEVDDTGVVDQLSVEPFGAPDLGDSAVVGGARDFLWTRRFYFQLQAGSPSSIIFPSNAAFPYSFDRANFDLRVKRKLRTGQALVFTAFNEGLGFAGAPGQIIVQLAYRILVGLSR